MELIAQPLDGVFVVRRVPHRDDRGYFARTYCEREFGQRGLVDRFVQWSVSFNQARATLRGMHWATGETKLVSCIAGAVHDVVADVRPQSRTRGKWLSYELSAASGDALYVPEGVAHGFLTLADEAVVQYGISAFYEPSAAKGFRWNDPTFAIEWPQPPRHVSARDLAYEDFRW